MRQVFIAFAFLISWAMGVWACPTGTGPPTVQQTVCDSLTNAGHTKNKAFALTGLSVSGSDSAATSSGWLFIGTPKDSAATKAYARSVSVSAGCGGHCDSTGHGPMVRQTDPVLKGTVRDSGQFIITGNTVSGGGGFYSGDVQGANLFAGADGSGNIYGNLVGSPIGIASTILSVNQHTVTFFGHSWIQSNGAFPTWPGIFCFAHSCITADSGDGSGIGSASPSYIGRIQNTAVNDSSIEMEEIAGNDMKHSPGTPLYDFARTVGTGIYWGAIADSKKQYYFDVNNYGSWTLDSLYHIGYLKTSTINDSIAFTADGTAIVFGLMMKTTGGSVQVFVDNVSKGFLSCKMTRTSFEGISFSPASYVISGLSAGSHNVRIVNAANTEVYFQWWYSGSQTDHLAPFVLIGGESNNPGSGISNDSVAKFTHTQDSLVAQARLFGANAMEAPFMLDTDPEAANFIPSGPSAGHPSVKGATAISDSVWKVFRITNLQYAQNILFGTTGYQQKTSYGTTDVFIIADPVTNDSRYRLTMNNGQRALNVSQNGQVTIGNGDGDGKSLTVIGTTNLDGDARIVGANLTLDGHLNDGLEIQRSNNSPYIDWLANTGSLRFRLARDATAGGLHLTSSTTGADSSRFVVETKILFSDTVTHNNLAASSLVGLNANNQEIAYTTRGTGTIIPTTANTRLTGTDTLGQTVFMSKSSYNVTTGIIENFTDAQRLEITGGTDAGGKGPFILLLGPHFASSDSGNMIFRVNKIGSSFEWRDSANNPILTFTNSNRRAEFRGSIQGDSSVIIGASAAGTGANKVLALSNTATGPSTSVGLAQLYSANISAQAAIALYQDAALVSSGAGTVTLGAANAPVTAVVSYIPWTFNGTAGYVLFVH